MLLSKYVNKFASFTFSETKFRNCQRQFLLVLVKCVELLQYKTLKSRTKRRKALWKHIYDFGKCLKFKLQILKSCILFQLQAQIKDYYCNTVYCWLFCNSCSANLNTQPMLFEKKLILLWGIYASESGCRTPAIHVLKGKYVLKFFNDFINMSVPLKIVRNCES